MRTSLSTVILTLVIISSHAIACPSALKHIKRKLNSQETVNLCQAYQGKTVLVVNTASYCNFTPQYDGLEDLYNDYKHKGLVVLGFPSHDFNQEDQDEAKIEKLCRLTYGVKFPMFEPLSVKGDEADVMFRQLSSLSGVTPKWNFYKYLITADGSSIKGYSSRAKPWAPEFREDIELALALNSITHKKAPLKTGQ